MKIYSTRHGQTEYNRLDLILGSTDIPLNGTGIEQAEILASNVALIKSLDIIISSPMLRAKETAMKVAERCNIPIIIDERLREWNYGEFEGKSRYVDGFADNKLEFAVRMGKFGESMIQLSHRVYSALDDIIEKYNNKNVLIVSHGGVCRVIETYFNDMTAKEFSGWFMGNCQLIEYLI